MRGRDRRDRDRDRDRGGGIGFGGDGGDGDENNKNNKKGDKEEDMSTPAKKTLDRIRSLRKQGEGGGDSLETTTPSDPSKTTSRRLEALRLKNSTRNKLNSSQDEKILGKEEKGDDPAIEEKEEKPRGPLVGIIHPIHIFPLQILPCTRQHESATQPLLYTPYPNPTIQCPDQNFFQNQSQPIRREGTWEIEQTNSIPSPSPSPSPKKERNEIHNDDTRRSNRRKRMEDNLREKDSQEEHENLLEENETTEMDSLLPSSQRDHATKELMSPSRIREGLYPGEGTVIMELLLRSEPVDLPTSALVSSGIYLSRSTQRLLRDALSQYSVQTLRQVWQTIRTNSHSHDDHSLASAVDKIQTPTSTRNPFANAKSQTTAENWQIALGYDSSTRDSTHQRSGISFLLRSEEHSDPTMRLMENWFDQRNQQQTHPATMKRLFFEDNDLATQRGSKSSTPHGHIFDGIGGTALQERKGVTLKVLAHEVTLSDHPYMSEEEATYVTLKRFYSQYSRHLRSKAYEYLPYRLLSLIAELRSLIHPLNSALQDISPKEFEPIVDRLYCDLLETLPVLCEYKATLEDLDTQLYSTWRKLIEIRRKQGFVSTRALLIGKNLQYSDEREREGEDEEKERDGRSPINFDTPANKYWNELLSELPSLPGIMKAAFEKSHPQNDPIPVSSSATLTPGLKTSGDPHTPLKKQYSSVPPPSSIAKKVQSEKPIQHAKAIEMIESAVDYLTPSLRGTSPSSILPTIVYRLSTTGAITPDDQVPLEEVERRNKLKRVRLRIVLKVHGQIVATSGNYQLQWPDLKVNFDQLYELRVLRQPANIVFDIFVSYELKSNLFSCCASLLAHETLVASVGVPLSQRQSPNEHAAQPAFCYSPAIAWYEFTSQYLMDASRGRGLVYVNNKPASNLSSIRLSGALLCGSEYDLAYDAANTSIALNNTLDGVYSSDIAYIPPSSDKGTHTGGRLIGGKLEFTREKDFFDLLPPLHLLDTHDPRNDLIVQHQLQGMLSGRLRKRNIFQFGGEYFSSLHSEEGVSYGNYFKYQPSNRLQLLRLRELKPYLFTEPIPLSEELIRTSELFKKILQNENKSHTTTNYLVDYLKESSGPISLDAHGVEESEDDLAASTVMASDLHSRHIMKANTFLSRVRDTQIVLSRQSRKKKVDLLSYSPSPNSHSPLPFIVFSSLPTQVVTSSVVHEVLEPLNEWNFFGLFGTVGLPERKRALKPKPVERTPEAIPKKCDIMIQIVSARNVPLRVSNPSSAGESGKKKAIGGGLSSRSSSRRGGGGGGDGNEENDFLLDDQEDDILQDKKRVNSFVEVTFQENRVRTTSIEGPAPVWKQSVSLPFNPPHGEFNHATLEQVTDMVTFTLFDEYVFDDAGRGGFLDGESTQREERFYLGSFSIPFSTILAEKRIEGTFRLETPSFNYGYVIPGLNQRRQSRRGPEFAPGGILGLFGFGGSTSSRQSTEERSNEANTAEQSIPDNLVKEFDMFCTTSSSTTLLTVMVTLDPLLVISPYVDSDVAISTTFPPDRPLVTYSQMWLQTIRQIGAQTKKRRYMLFGSNSDGLSVLICRYLKPLVPPPGVTSRRACIHLVSLIPFIPDSQAFVGEFDLWCTASQTWQIMGGDEEEHGTLLYNYLYYLSLRSRGIIEKSDEKKKNESSRDRFYTGYPAEEFIRNEELFLVIGDAIPEGSTIYVMMRVTSPQKSTIQVSGREQSNKSIDNTPTGWVLINPVTGHIYSAADPHCPLREISCLVTPYNIWTNIQKSSKPNELLFDVFQMSHWRPLFGQRFRPNIPGLTPIQTDVVYEPTSPALCFEIEKILKNEIKSHLRKWRSKRAKSVTLHPEVSTTMTDMLNYLEEWKMYGTIDGNATFAGQGGAGAGGGGEGEGDVIPGQADGGGIRHSNLSSSASRVRLSSNNNSTPYHVLRVIEEKATNRLKNILHSNVLRGYPINTPYTDVGTILNKIKLCCLHEIKHPDVLFVVSVKCFPLFNGLFSVWLFLGTLEKERS